MLLMRSVKRQKRETPFGNEVRRLRKAAALSQEELGARIGISREAVGDIERGETEQPGDDVLDKLEQHIKLSRQHAFELMQKVPSVDRSDVEAVISRAADEKDPDALRAYWRSLPVRVRAGIRNMLAADLVGGGEQERAANEE